MKTATREPTARPAAQPNSSDLRRPLDSAVLLGHRGEVDIVHQGETYRLRRTRQGKLILTK